MVEPTYRWSANTESAELDGTWVVLDVAQYTVTTFTEVGGFVWSRMQQPTTKGDIVRDVLGEYEVPINQADYDVSKFLDQLVQLGIVQYEH